MAFSMVFRCVSITPFGSLVVPDVKLMVMVSSSSISGRARGESSCAASLASKSFPAPSAFPMTQTSMPWSSATFATLSCRLSSTSSSFTSACLSWNSYSSGVRRVFSGTSTLPAQGIAA